MSDWIGQTWDRVVITAPTMPLRHSMRADEFCAAVDIWAHTCEIILAKAPRKHQGEQWDNRRVGSPQI